MNYQLARTNTYLSGQLKIDLTLNKNKGDLCVEDVHLSPVSNYTGFGWGNDPDDLLDGRHIENIKNFYSKTSNIFYEECLNPSLVSEYPIYSPNFVIDTHNNDNKMGLYRVPIKTYGKPYAFFCPFWITDPSKFLGTRFKFTFYKYINANPLNDYMNEADADANNTDYPEEKIRISSITLPMVDLEDKTVHNKFVKYFNDYLNGFTSHKYDIKTDKFLTSNVVSNAFELNVNMDISNVNIANSTEQLSNTNDSNFIKSIEFKPIGTLNDTTASKITANAQIAQKPTNIEKEITEPFLSDDLVYLSFKENKGWVKGIDPQAGTYVNKDISYLCDTLLEKERPLMDNDYYLARIFKDNTVIAQQLINFNFLFDIADIIPHIVYEELQYCRFGIEVEIEQPIDDEGNFETLQLRDFYSNYEFIPNAYIIRTDNNLEITYDSNKVGDNYMNIVNSKFDGNALSYKNNADYIQYVYKNKLEQNIIHWGIGDSKYIFNLYDGFTPIVVDKYEYPNTVKHEVAYKSSGDMPFSPNIAINKFSASHQTPLWSKIMPIGISLTQLREKYQTYYTGFNVNTEWIEGAKYDFSNIDYNEILTDLFKLGITDIDTIDEIDKYLNGRIWVKLLPISTASTDENYNVQFNIQRYGDVIFITVSENIKYLSFIYVLEKLKKNLFPTNFIPLNVLASKFIEDKPIKLQQESKSRLTKLPNNAVKFAGVSSIFKKNEEVEEIEESTTELIPPVVETLVQNDSNAMNPILRGLVQSGLQNSGGKMIIECGFEYSINNIPQNNLVSWHRNYPLEPTPSEFYSQINVNDNDIITYRAYIKYGTYPQLVVPDEKTVLGDYIQFKALTDEEKLNISAEYFLYWFMNHALMPSAISFNSGYASKIAESPTNESTEVEYSISNMNMLENATLYRYDGKLQPLFITVDDKTEDKNTEKNLINYSNYIIQYEQSLQSIPAFNAYNNTKYLPEYPSVGYSSMASETIDYDHSASIQYYGDKSCNIYRGERRWYNGSFMYFLPRKIEMSIISTEYNENAIFSGFANEILTNMGLTEPTLTEDTTEADIQEYIRNNVDFVMNYILPLYSYDSKCSIKYKENTVEKNIPELDENKNIKYIYDVIFELI